MQVEFLSKFSKDIDGINQKSVISNLHKLIRLLELSKELNKVPNLKNLWVISRLIEFELVIIELVFFMKIIKSF